MARRSGLDGFDDVARAFTALGKVPQSSATKAARAGASIARKAVKAGAPVDEGDLKNAIIMQQERRKKPGKAVFDVLVDPAKNAHFVKISKDGQRSYYPASQEYGFLTVDGEYVPGYRYFKKGVEDNADKIERKMLEVTSADIDRAMKGKR